MQSIGNNAPAPMYEPLGLLLDLARRARAAADCVELAFTAVNDTHALVHYRQAGLWFKEDGIKTLSGVVQIEANAPYVQWLNRVCQALSMEAAQQPRPVSAADLPEKEAEEWHEWLPAYALWLPLAAGGDNDLPGPGGLLLARETPWSKQEVALLSEWIDIWRHAWHARFRPQPWSLKRLRAGLAAYLKWEKDRLWWKQRSARWAALVCALLLMPVRLTVLAPGELVPAAPAVIRAPLEGVVSAFFIKPNDDVKAGQRLFDFDDAPLASRLAVATQSLATASAEYRQAAQLAVSDSKSKAQLAMLMGKIEERKAEVDYLRGQLERAHVVAPVDGIALFDDPAEWIGKPVVTGERIMRIAAPNDVEVEAWLAIGDAIPLEPGASVKLFLNASPLFAVTARLRYVAHDAIQRADGSYAYRVRAALEDKTDHHVGLKGTAKLNGGWVPAVYWILRRPIAAVRQATGW